MSNEECKTFGSELKRNLLRGLMIMTPIAVVVILIELVYGSIDNRLGPSLAYLVRLVIPSSWMGPFSQGNIPGLSLAFVLFLLAAVGWIDSWYLGRKGLSLIDCFFLAIPGIRTIYSAVRKLVDTLSDTQKSAFQRVVWIPWGWRDSKTLAFATSETVDATTGRKYVTVCIPTPPNPFSGPFIVVPADQVVESGLSLDEALKIVMSFGVLTPPALPITRASAPPSDGRE